MNDTVALERMNLRKWYGYSLRIPTRGSWGYIDFLVSSLGIVRSIVREKMGRNINIAFMKGGTAHADWDNMVISINEAFLMGEFTYATDSTVVPPDSDLTISAILGIVVHESAHFAYSPPTKLSWIDYIREHTKCAFHEKVAGVVGNIIEDIYIEAELDREMPSLMWMLDCTNEIFFDRFSEEETLREAARLTEAPVDLQQVAAAMDVLIYAKTREQVETTLWLSSLFSLCRTAQAMPELTDRLSLALEIYDALMERVTESECQNPSAGTADALSESLQRSQGLFSEHAQGECSLIRAESPPSTEVEVTLQELKDAKFSVMPPNSHDRPTTLFIEKRLPPSAPTPSTQRYAPLIELARQRTAANRPYGVDRERGHTMRKLYRIATDSKIFAEPVQMPTFKPMRVIVLVDCSGSMSGERIANAMIAANGAAQALVEAQCEVAVYGHTGDIYSDNEVIIYTFKEFHEPVSILPTALGAAVCKDRKILAENRDGYAIRYVAAKFYGGSRKELLIVISDGAPLANGYSGPSAITHTRQCVDDVRRSGVEVLSISITPEAQVANQCIYGRGKDVYDQDPNVISALVQALLLG